MVKLEIYYINLLYSHQTIQRQMVKLEIYYVNLLYSHQTIQRQKLGYRYIMLTCYILIKPFFDKRLN